MTSFGSGAMSNSIRDIAEQSADGASQTSSASDELARLATDLNGMVQRFRL